MQEPLITPTDETTITPPPAAAPSFAGLGLSESLVQAVTEKGYTTPTPIQAQAIPMVLARRDVVGVAQTGTGKTASFTLPMIDFLAGGRSRARMPRSLILEPTRELALQVSDNFTMYGKHSNLSQALLIGGMGMEAQEKLLTRGVDVLIATPGRLLDHFGRGELLLMDVKTLVIDEADRMLDMGFIPDVEKIIKLLSPQRQTLLFSATMPPEIRRLAEQFLSNPVTITVARQSSTAETITQHVVKVSSMHKRAVLRHLLQKETVDSAIIFCNRKRDVDILHRSLKKHGFGVGLLHGDLAQPVRLKILEDFKSGATPLLVASDVAARGLDIPSVSHVFNFDVPIHPEDYVHRIGRTGRAGRDGKAFMLATADESKALAAIETMIGKAVPELTLTDFTPPSENGGDADAGERRPPRGDRRERGSRPPRRDDRSSRADDADSRGASRDGARRSLPPRDKRPPRPFGGTPNEQRFLKPEPIEDLLKPVQGLGDHVPDFLKRS